MMTRLFQLPFFVVLTGIASVAMLLPSMVALADRQYHTSRTFFYSSTMTLFVLAIVVLTIRGTERKRTALRDLFAFLVAFIVLPAILAVPFYESLRTTTFLNAYFEMVSSMTTTGASMFDDPERLSPALHMWRATVAWLGGLLMWVAAAAILAPLNLGGFEVTARFDDEQGSNYSTQMQLATPAKRLQKMTRELGPTYLALTLTLWVCLMVAGDRPIVALQLAMSTLSTSGITMGEGLDVMRSGYVGEFVILLFLSFGISRITFSGDTKGAKGDVLSDPEVRMAALIIIGIPVLLLARHMFEAFDNDAHLGFIVALKALWGAVFTVTSFLTTTGFVSGDWAEAQIWSGLKTPGLILLGLSVIGGGVATTAGGVKLLRVYALYLNGQREIDKLVHPNSVGHSKRQNRRLRKKGAFVAWVFFMLFIVSFSVITIVLTALDVSFENALILSIAMLSTTGPLLEMGTHMPISVADLSDGAKMVLNAAMILGRLETLAIIALFTPQLWQE